MRSNFNFHSILLCLIIFTGLKTNAQEYSFKDYKFDTNIPIVSERNKNENEVVLKRSVKVEIISFNNESKQFYLVHESRLINADDAIEKNNKVYIPLGSNERLVETKLRVILKGGRILEFDKKDIKEEVDQEKGMRYNYFAINGLEKGAIVEKIFIIEESLDLKGKTVGMQEDYPIESMDFELIYPSHLVFKTKAVYGTPEPVVTTDTVSGKTSIYVVQKDIPKLIDDEQSSNWIKNARVFRYKLDENRYTGARNMFNYKSFATAYYTIITAERTKKELKAISEFCNSIAKSTDVTEQIRNIERKIKSTIVYDRYIERKEGLDDVIKSKQANQTDIIKIYHDVLNYFKVENNIVFASNRYKIPFDIDFESYENLSEVLFYFPEIKKYLTPTEIEYRLPLFPPSLGNNSAVFLKSRTFAGVPMGVSELGFVALPGTDITNDSMDITIDFRTDLENPVVSAKLSFGGYTGANIQPIKDFVSADQYKTVLKSFAENYTVNTDYTNLKAENDGLDFVGKEPFILSVVFDGKDLVQKAGTSYLFSVGQTIGKQSELYQERKRMMPIELNYPHAYKRTIHILLPPDINVKNLEKINMNFKVQKDQNVEAEFSSKYLKTASEITIENEEFYNAVNYPLTNFESYRSVLNAAADFNKIVLVLSKS